MLNLKFQYSIQYYVQKDRLQDGGLNFGLPAPQARYLRQVLGDAAASVRVGDLRVLQDRKSVV